MIWVIITLNCYDFLILVKIDQELSLRVSKMMLLTNFSLPLQVMNQIIQIYCSSQQITTPFFFSNIISFFVTIYFGRKFIIVDDYREIGFCFTRIAQEIFNVAFSMTVMFISAHKESLSLPNLKLIKVNFWNYLKYNMKTSVAFYGELFSFELNTYFAARLGDINQLASYIAIINSMFFIFYISVGFSNTFRTNIGNTLGAGDIPKAKSICSIYVVYVLIISIFIILIIERFCDKIALIYSGDIYSVPIVMKGIRAYYWNVFPTFILYSLNSVLRFLDRNTLAVNITAFFMPSLVFIFSGIMAFKMNMGPVGLVYGFAVSKITAIIIFFYVIYTADWEKSYKAFTKNNQKSIKE